MRRILTTCLRGYRRLSSRLPAGMDPVHRWIGALCSTALTDQEKSSVTRVCYESSAHVSESPARGLFPWEDAWFQMALPQPPATILVPGAGGGREVLALRERGYTVFGFDPAIGQSPNAHGIIRESFEALSNRDEKRLRFPGAEG